MALVSRFKPRLACLQPAIGRSSIGAPSRPPESRGRSVRCLATATSAPASRPPNWVADLNARLGKCIMFGCSPTQVQRAAAVLREMASHWRAIIAGSESFITGRGRGLSGQEVAWGEMDSFVRFSPAINNAGQNE
ncbi:putative Thioesterase-like superfamily-domain-containing protein [Seiridium unicorne]|uniref:Thioesterase-like superfamily-domain-containing protein n=1 Tax=Seiridium unicorne TaxID=138068 RepID=A0ABR2V9G4_9PEZI